VEQMVLQMWLHLTTQEMIVLSQQPVQAHQRHIVDSRKMS
jgi:hypothetical protein